MGFAVRKQDDARRYEERDAILSAVPSAPLEVVLVRPAQYEDVSRVAGLCGGSRLVLVNLEELPGATVRRIVDFLSGVAYGLDGRLVQVSRGSYAVVPADAQLMDRRAEEPDEWDRYFT